MRGRRGRRRQSTAIVYLNKKKTCRNGHNYGAALSRPNLIVSLSGTWGNGETARVPGSTPRQKQCSLNT